MSSKLLKFSRSTALSFDSLPMMSVRSSTLRRTRHWLSLDSVWMVRHRDEPSKSVPMTLKKEFRDLTISILTSVISVVRMSTAMGNSLDSVSSLPS